MKKILNFVLMAAIFILLSAQSKAAEKYVQSAGSSVFTLDREAGTITRHIRGSSQGSILQSETLSCKYGYIVTINGESTAMLDLLAPLSGAQASDAAIKRAEFARKECRQYNIEPNF